MNIFKVNKILNLILILVLIYACFTFFNQQAKLNSYSQDISYYTAQKEELNLRQKELLEEQKNVNSEEYIEEVARKKLEMYLPNETVYEIINQ